MEDSISKLITKHDNEHFTLEQLIDIAKNMLTRYDKDTTELLFSMMYAPHIKTSYKKEIARKCFNGESLFRQIHRGMKLGKMFREYVSAGTPTLSNSVVLSHNNVCKKFIFDVFKYLESTGEFEELLKKAEINSAQLNDGCKNVILQSKNHKCTGLLLIATEEQIKERQKTWNTDADSILRFDNNNVYIPKIIGKNKVQELGKLIYEFFEGKYFIKNNTTTKEYELHRKQDKFNEPTEIKFGDHKPDQRIYFGTPGGGKSHKVKEIIKGKNAENREFRTTFHPDSDYASFVGSYKPVMDGKEITYKFIPQMFTNAYVAAWNNPANDYYLVIEEINRGNCAQIFGDIFQLLDRKENGFSEYPIAADADLKKYLEEGTNENGEPILIHKQGIRDGYLCLPPNLSILATMNTSDQSLFPMDSAFKRRWAWEFVPSIQKNEDNYTLTFGSKEYEWHKFLNAVNPRIKEATDSEDKQLGAYFIKSNMDAKDFISKVMYYLWSEICKDEYKTRNNFFRHKVGDKPDVEFTFSELYDNGTENVTLLNEFMDYILKKE